MTSPQTELMHRGDDRRRHHGSINTPVYRASLFSFETYQDYLDSAYGEGDAPVYSRNSNPTRQALESKIAYLEKTDRAIAFSSGMGAISAALLSFVKAGDHILVVSCCYGPTRQFCDDFLSRLGVTVEYFPSSESADLSHRLKPNTRLIYLESPGTRTFEIQDIRAVAKLAQANNIITIFDNSWATPLYQQPVSMGIDVVVHSGTKYIAGHSDVVVGLLACRNELYETIKPVASFLGANLSPDDAYLVTRGLRTLPLRLAQAQKSALEIARWLQNRPEVRQVYHPGLPDFPGYALGKSQMQGYSSLFSFKLRPAGKAACHAFANSLRYFSIGVSWGGFESLILPQGHQYQDDPQKRAELDIDDDLFRVCIGLEDTEDLKADLERGFAAWEDAAA